MKKLQQGGKFKPLSNFLTGDDMPLYIPQYHITGIENRIWNSYKAMSAFLEKSNVSPGDAPAYWVDHIEQTPDPEEFMWDKK